MATWKKNTKINPIVTCIEQLYEALIHLAYEKLPCFQGQRKLLPVLH